jgi:hypothetical protein
MFWLSSMAPSGLLTGMVQACTSTNGQLSTQTVRLSGSMAGVVDVNPK